MAPPIETFIILYANHKGEAIRVYLLTSFAFSNLVEKVVTTLPRVGNNSIRKNVATLFSDGAITKTLRR